ncbi:MAG: hypothetical protein ACOYT4_04950 [Nanoarchaeota archaeon]
MIKGILLAISGALFIVSLIFTISSLRGRINDNLVTGAVIGVRIVSINIISLLLSFALILFLISKIRNQAN